MNPLHGRVFRQAWIDGIRAHYPGEPKSQDLGEARSLSNDEPVMDFHYVLTLQGGPATGPRTITFSGTWPVDHGYSRKAVYERLLEEWSEHRDYREFFQGPMAVLFFSLEPDQLG